MRQEIQIVIRRSSQKANNVDNKDTHQSRQNAHAHQFLSATHQQQSLEKKIVKKRKEKKRTQNNKTYEMTVTVDRIENRSTSTSTTTTSRTATRTLYHFLLYFFSSNHRKWNKNKKEKTTKQRIMTINFGINKNTTTSVMNNTGNDTSKFDPTDRKYQMYDKYPPNKETTWSFPPENDRKSRFCECLKCLAVFLLLLLLLVWTKFILIIFVSLSLLLSKTAWVHAHNSLRYEFRQLLEAMEAIMARCQRDHDHTTSSMDPNNDDGCDTATTATTKNKSSCCSLTEWDIRYIQQAWKVHEIHFTTHQDNEDYILVPFFEKRFYYPQQTEFDHIILANKHVRLTKLISSLRPGDTIVPIYQELKNFVEQFVLPHFQQEEDECIPLMRAYFQHIELKSMLLNMLMDGPDVEMGSLAYTMGIQKFRTDYSKQEEITPILWHLFLKRRVKYFEREFVQPIERLKAGRTVIGTTASHDSEMDGQELQQQKEQQQVPVLELKEKKKKKYTKGLNQRKLKSWFKRRRITNENIENNI